MVRFVSTRGRAESLGFTDAMLAGLARDGGLYVPETVPTLDHTQIAGFAGAPYEDVALQVMWPFVRDTLDRAAFEGCIERAYERFGHPARAPLKQLGPGLFLLELFHGPTLAFKDFAMQLIGQLFQEALTRLDRTVTVVGATSGDTGSAAIEAFQGLERVQVFILYPDGRVSEVQRRQMTTVSAPNVHAIAVEGDFDTCQALVKAMFNDLPFRDGVGLAGVNSINFARVLAQIVYFFSSATSLGAPFRPVSFSVPTGNFGDIYAGYLAKRMGLPVDKLVVATNQNDILHRCLTTARYDKGRTMPSISPSMDIQVSSNFERALFHAYGGDGPAISALMEELKTGGFRVSQGAHEALSEVYASGRVSEDETRAQIASTYAATGELLCPHTAIGVDVAHAQGQRDVPMVALATAHPAKFPDAVHAAIGLRPELPPRMADLYTKPERITRVPDDLAEVQAHISDVIGQ